MEFFGRTASVYAGGKTSNGNAPYGDGGPKEAATFHRPEAMDFGPDGSLYISEFPPVGWGVVRKISPNGIVTRIAGVYGNDPGWEHDGRPANELGLASPLDLDVDPWGNVVICGDNGGEVTLVDPAGHGTWLVEQQALAAPRGDGDLAVNANLKSCDGAVRTSDGTVFIADKDDRRIRRIGADGIITTAVGGGTMTTEGVAATAAQLSGPTELALDRDENLLICDGTKVKRVDSAGIITTIAGGGSPADGLGDGLQATAAKLAGCGSMTVGPDGKLYISGNTAKRVRVVDVDRIIRTLAGNGTIVNPYTQTVPWGVAALNFPLAEAEGLAVSPDNRVFVLEARYDAVVELGPDPVPTDASGDYLVPSQDGRELFTFDASGRHLTTLDAVSAEIKWAFGYNDYGDDSLLTTIEDHEGQTTRFERDSVGRLTAIVGPYGHRNGVALDADGYLASVENPAGEATALQYDTGLAEGLLLQKTDAGGGVHQYGYDGDGRLVSDSSPTGRTVALTRTESSTGHAVLYTTSEGRKTKHEVSEDRAGVVLRTKTDAFGGVTTTTTATTGTTTVTYPDGRSLAVTPATSDRFGGVLPMNQRLVVTLPSGLSTTIESDETVVLSDPSDPLSVSLITQTSTIAGQKYTRVIDPAAGTETETSPTGKSVVTTRDDLGRVTAVAYASGAAPLEAAWDAEGRLASVLHGDYEKLYTYDGSGRPTSKQWGSRSLSLAYDDADRVRGRFSSRIRPRQGC